MPVPSVITDLSTAAASNYPQGSDSPSIIDDCLRAQSAFIASLQTGVGNGVVGISSPSFQPIGSSIPPTGNGFYLPGTNTIGWATASAQRGTVNAAGNWTINAPSSGYAMTVSNAAGAAALRVNGTSGSNSVAGAYACFADGGTGTNRLLFSVNSTAAYIYAGGSIANPDIVVANNDGSQEMARFIGGANTASFQVGQGGGVPTKVRHQQWSNYYLETGIDAGGVSYANAVLNGGKGQFDVRRNGTATASFGPAGNVTIGAPDSGYALNLPSKTPASAADTGTAGDHSWDANYLYICTATNTWKRAALATW